MYFPTWIDLKGADAVPETVHHCVSFHAFIPPLSTLSFLLSVHSLSLVFFLPSCLSLCNFVLIGRSLRLVCVPIRTSSFRANKLFGVGM